MKTSSDYFTNKTNHSLKVNNLQFDDSNQTEIFSENSTITTTIYDN